jgi:hypothetical protein
MEKSLTSNKLVFVFGSNKAGRHGKGAAKYAMDNYGAVYGKGEGYYGNSYAIATKGYNLEPMEWPEIELSVREFLNFAEVNPELNFELTPIGCGLAGHSIQSLKGSLKFYGMSNNVFLSKSWLDYL